MGITPIFYCKISLKESCKTQKYFSPSPFLLLCGKLGGLLLKHFPHHTHTHTFCGWIHLLHASVPFAALRSFLWTIAVSLLKLCPGRMGWDGSMISITQNQKKMSSWEISVCLCMHVHVCAPHTYTHTHRDTSPNGFQILQDWGSVPSMKANH